MSRGAITLVNENSLSDFDFDVLDGAGQLIARSSSDGQQQLINPFCVFCQPPLNVGHYIDFVQLKIAAGAELTVRVSAKTYPAFPTYRSSSAQRPPSTTPTSPERTRSAVTAWWLVTGP